MAFIRLTTTPGLEDIVATDSVSLLTAAGIEPLTVTEKPFAVEGNVLVECQIGGEAVMAVFSRHRAIYHVIEHVFTIAWNGESETDLAQAIADSGLPELESTTSFRVSCTRLGEHPFQSPDVERAVGTSLQRRYGTAVDLEDFTTNVQIDVIGSTVMCGYRRTGRGVDQRHDWAYHPRVTLKTPVAYAMLVLSGYVSDPGRLHDPFCGSGTILMEAAAFGDAPISGSDWREEAVAGARSNVARQSVGQALPDARITVEEWDARELNGLVARGSLDYIVTNPPFGVRMARGTNFLDLYRRFVEQAVAALRPGGALAVLVGRRRAAFNKVLQETAELTLRHVRVINLSGIYPAIFVLERT